MCVEKKKGRDDTSSSPACDPDDDPSKSHDFGEFAREFTG